MSVLSSQGVKTYDRNSTAMKYGITFCRYSVLHLGESGGGGDTPPSKTISHHDLQTTSLQELISMGIAKSM